MEIVIRRLDPGEWTVYRDVRLAALRDSPSAFASAYDDAVEFDEADWRVGMELPAWVAFDGENAIGMVRLAGGEDAIPNLISMWVAPVARGSAVGADLVAAVLDHARAHGSSGVALEVVTDNARARSFYHRCGFVPTGVASVLPDGRHEIEMLHPLAVDGR